MPCLEPRVGNETAQFLQNDCSLRASVKRDSTAIVAVTWDNMAKKVNLVSHRIFQPTVNDPLNFEATIEQTLRDLCSRFSVRGVYFDPYQMQSTARRLQASNVPMREYPQSVPNLTAAGSNNRFTVANPARGMILKGSDHD